MISDILKNKLEEYYNQDEVKNIIEGYKRKRYFTLRINTLKISIDDLLIILDNNGILYDRVEWFSNALIIKNKTEEDIKKMDIYENGFVYFQSLSSMLPPLFLNVKDGENILDMTAAPGGKTSEICMLGNNNVMVTATERNKGRFERLKYNLDKLGCKKVNVMQIDARDLDDFYVFDKILLDAPCSGSGTLNIDNINLFSLDLVNNVNSIQKILLKKAIKLVKSGSIIVYSTCSILKCENEEVLDYVRDLVDVIPIDLSNYDLPLLHSNIDGVVTLYPNELYEGFFVSVLKKK